MKRKIIWIMLIFILALGLLGNVSNAAKTKLTTLVSKANSGVSSLLDVKVTKYVDGSTGAPSMSKSWYCFYEDSKGGNGKKMLTAVVDVGVTSLTSVENIVDGKTTKTLSATNSTGAVYAMRVAYLATRSYEEKEPWGGTQRSPYRLAMQYYASNYAKTMKKAGLFNSQLNANVHKWTSKFENQSKKTKITNEAKKYTTAVENFAFKDQSTKGKQTITQKGDYTFVGPYKITKTGADKGGLSSEISSIVLTTGDKTTYNAYGWSTSLSTSGIKNNKEVPNGKNFYIVFKTKNITSVKNIEVKRKVSGALVARIVFCGSDGGQDIGVYAGKTSKEHTYSITLPGVEAAESSIIVTKESNSGEKLKGVKFIVYNETEKKWVKKGTPATLVSNKSDASKYETDANGIAKIEKLNKTGKYVIYEIYNPYPYYAEASVDNPSASITVDVSSMGKVVNKTFINEQKYIKITGYAWEDGISTKTSVRNNLWSSNEDDNNDKRLTNVKVYLKNSKGTVLEEATTSKNGEYVFGDFVNNSKAAKIEIKELENLYVEFEYNGMNYESVSAKPAQDKGSKAKDNDLRDNFNNNYATIVKGQSQNANGEKVYDLTYKTANHISTINYGGTYLYGYVGQSYPIAGIKQQYLIKASTKYETDKKLILGKETTLKEIKEKGIVDNVNLGLRVRTMPDLAVKQDVEEVQIKLNDYTHTYKYAQRFENPKDRGGDGFNISVKFKNEYGAPYTREIYSSDIVYNQQEGTQGKLQVYLKYKIAVGNMATTQYTRVNELVNYYDERYEIETIKDESGKDVHYEKDSSYNQSVYKKLYINTNKMIEHEKEAVYYITYKLTNNAVNVALNQQLTLDSVTEVTSYSTFEDAKGTKKYAGIDKNSQPGNTVPENIDTYEDDTDKAPSMILKSTNNRVIKGTVWEDSAIASLLAKDGYDKQRIGNGKYDATTENAVEKVKVELLNTDGNVATLYKKSGETEAATKETDSSGNYEFDGVLPGEYFIKYTYGNESIIKSKDGDTICIINPEDYKATIYRGGNKTEGPNDYWYVNEIGSRATRLSDAKDTVGIRLDGSRNENFVEDRIKTEDITYKVAQEQTAVKAIEADTKKFNVAFEYDVNADNISPFGVDLKFIFDNIDFGIIKRPEQDIEVTKEISFVEVILANGQKLIEGDPRLGNLKYVMLLDNGKIHLQIDNELIQGANLKVTYDIIVDNKGCEVDYDTLDYYEYGIIPANKATHARVAKVKELFDYVSKNLNYEKETKITYNGATVENKDIWQEVNVNAIGADRLSAEAYEVVKGLNTVLYTTEFADIAPGERRTVPLQLATILSNQSTDFTYDNEVEINLLHGRTIKSSTPGNYVPGEGPDEPDSDIAEMMVTGPYGENRQYAYYIIIGLGVCAVLGVGIFLTKKFVIK